MIAFATAVAEPDAFHAYTEPGIRLAAEPGAEVIAYGVVGSGARSQNLLLEAAARMEDLEALVLLHPHAQLTDPELCTKVRAALADPDVAIVGAAGARGVTGAAWWEGDVVTGDVTQRYQEEGGGELPAYAWAGARRVAPGEVEEVDAVDQFLMVLSPWAVRELRFDERRWLGPGYEVDLCRRARAAGRKVLVADIALTVHRALHLVGDQDLWMLGHLQDATLAEPEDDATDWEARALKAEAELDAAKAIRYFNALVRDRQLEAARAELTALTSTPGWGLTAPLRAANARRSSTRA